MKMDFILCEINEDSKLWSNVSKYNNLNEFIIVGEEKEYYKVQQLTETGIKLIGGLKLDECSYQIVKTDVGIKKDGMIGIPYVELDIPKVHLTVDLIETIERLNQ